ncbi:MAG: Trk system potassium transporter TrkA [Pseudomonadota bacterium]
MKIIILGAGQVGGTLAISLAKEPNNDVIIVDVDARRLDSLKEQLDLGTVHGHCSYPKTLREAGAEDADMLIAVTNSDETNMVACQVAWGLFHIQTKIARVRSVNYLNFREIFSEDNIPIDVVISPEQLVTNYILNLIKYPGALQVMDFASGAVRLVAVKAYYGGPLVGNELAALREHMPKVDSRVAAIYRRGNPIVPTGETVLEADDEVFFIAAKRHIRKIMGELQKLEPDYHKIIIAGGGHVGLGIAHALERDHQVTIIERDRNRAIEISRQLEHAIVIQGDASNEDIAMDDRHETIDLFVAVTDNDEANIMSAMLAKQRGVRKTMVLIKRTVYAELVQEYGIDVAISPQQTTIGALLTHIRRGDIANAYSLRNGAAEAIEAIAHGNEQNSKVVGRAIGDLNLPAGASIGALVRGEKVLIAHDNVVIQEDDHVVMFLVNRNMINEIEKLFQVDVTFI